MLAMSFLFLLLLILLSSSPSSPAYCVICRRRQPSQCGLQWELRLQRLRPAPRHRALRATEGCPVHQPACKEAEGWQSFSLFFLDPDVHELVPCFFATNISPCSRPRNPQIKWKPQPPETTACGKPVPVSELWLRSRTLLAATDGSLGAPEACRKGAVLSFSQLVGCLEKSGV